MPPPTYDWTHRHERLEREFKNTMHDSRTTSLRIEETDLGDIQN
jgi:hypothetical protein